MEAERPINPLMHHLQKLALELKCPICFLLSIHILYQTLQLFERPVLLPCNHIFCSSCQIARDCAVCKQSFIDRELKPATFMENILTIYKNVEVLNANSIHHVCSDTCNASTHCPASNKSKSEIGTSVPNLTSDSVENLVDGSFDKPVAPQSVKKQAFNTNGCAKHKEKAVEGVGFMRMEKLNPPLSSERKDVDGSDPNGNHKRPAESGAYDALKKSRSISSKLDTQTTNLASEKVAAVNPNSQTESEKLVWDEQSGQLDLKNRPCAFCKVSDITDGSGAMVAYSHGKEIKEKVSRFSKVTYVHVKCAEWAPLVCFENETNKLKCTSCGKKGAALGCCAKSCQNTYHVPCAYNIPDCRWDVEEFNLLCPTHVSHKFPKEKKLNAGKQDDNKRIPSSLTSFTTVVTGEKKLVLCGSTLSSEQMFVLVDFAKRNGGSVSKYWKDNVTHVIVATDSNGACTRTLKVLMAILTGKWIVTMECLKACVEAGHVVKEEPYEVQLDTYGCSGGPKAGRLRAMSHGPKLFNNMKFCFVGNFVEAFKADLLNLVKTAGGTMVENVDKLSSTNYTDVKLCQTTLVVYNADISICAGTEDEDFVLFQRVGAAEDVAQEYGFQVVGHTWILDSIAACCLLPFT